MEMIRWQIRIAMLWILVAVAMSAHTILLCVDSSISKLIAEWSASVGDAEWVASALLWMVPLWMAFVTFTAKGASNRWANFVVGILFTLLNIYHFFVCGIPLLKGGAYTKATPHHILILVSIVLATALISWYAWKYPKQEA